MSVISDLRPARAELAERAHLLLVGDALAVTGLIIAGELRHNVDPIAQPLVVADTLAPFLLGWFLAAVVLGAFDAEAMAGPLAAARVAAVTWVVAALVGLALRATPLYSGGVSGLFPVVMVVTGLAVMVPWRVAASRLL